MTPEHLVFYDGECGFCDGTVVLLKATSLNSCIATLQGDLAQSLLPQYNLEDLDSIVYLHSIRKFAVRIHSDAIVHVGSLTLALVFRTLDAVCTQDASRLEISAVCKRRIRWFGKVESCTLPTKRKPSVAWPILEYDMLNQCLY